ncbi:NB-ARC domain-containing protein [Streptomyces sp. NPDC048288]|uniref:NB-ARC domain-containing protein n=1 Tax=Streptomyces sp. NPDC048288 TaxID=3365529 RepID=UPI003721FDD1
MSVGRPEKPLAQDAGPATAFALELRRLRAAAGSPSYRELARRALFSASVLSDAAAGYRLPTLQVALAFAEACGGDRAAWERRWRAAAGSAGDEPAPAAAKTAHQAPEPRLRAAAVRALLPVPAQLPTEPRPLAGRSGELAAARALTAPADGPVPPLVIHGQTGAGKSALALRLAHELAADLPDGQLYVGLGTAADGRKDAAGIAGGLLQSLGIPAEHIPNDPAQRIGLYRSVLAERRLLIVFDGTLQERQVRDLLVAGEHSRILVTARSRLLGLDGVRRLALPVLDRDESMELLAGVLGAERLRGAPRAGLLLAEACGDLPLALTLAGRRLAARPEALLPEAVAELVRADGLSGRLRVGDETLVERYDDSYRRLTPRARLILHRFATSGAAPSVDGVTHASATALAQALEPARGPAQEPTHGPEFGSPHGPGHGHVLGPPHGPAVGPMPGPPHGPGLAPPHGPAHGPVLGPAVGSVGELVAESVEEGVEDVLEAVVDSGLLERTDVPGQYGLPPLVGQFARARPVPATDAPDPGRHRPPDAADPGRHRPPDVPDPGRHRPPDVPDAGQRHRPADERTGLPRHDRPFPALRQETSA